MTLSFIFEDTIKTYQQMTSSQYMLTESMKAKLHLQNSLKIRNIIFTRNVA